MKKKTIDRFASLCLAAMAVALCACNDADLYSGSHADNEQRPVAGTVQLMVGRPTPAVDNRLNYDRDGYHFEEGDVLAACLMDCPTQTEKPDANWYEKYVLTEYISTNYPFVRQADGTWQTSAKLSEGNYFFMFPYNSGKGSRQSYTHTLGRQSLTDGSMASLMRLYATANFFVGYAMVPEGTTAHEAVRVDMRPVYGALGLTLKNNGKTSYTLRRMTVSRPAEGFCTTVVVNPTTCTVATTDGRFNIAQYVGDDSEAGRANGYEDNRKDYTRAAALDDLVKPQPHQTAVDSIALDMPNGITVEAGREQRLLLMLPQGTYHDLVVELEADEGFLHRLLLKGETVIALDRGTNRTLAFDDSDVSLLPTIDASATDDLARLIRWNKDIATNLTANLKSNVRMTADMYAMLRDGKSTQLLVNLNGHALVLDKDVDETALCGKLLCNDVAPKQGRVVVTGKQVVNGTTGSGVIRNENELLLQAGAACDIENRGKLTVEGDVKEMKSITSAGTVMVKEAACLGGALTMEAGGLLVNRGTVLSVANEGLVQNYGTVEAGSNDGELDNEGTVTLQLNTGILRALGTSATLIADNATDAKNGQVLITSLASEGNLKVTGKKGNIVQELQGEVSTADIRDLANTLWLDGTLTGAYGADSKPVDIDLSAYEVVAIGNEARLWNAQKELKVGNIVVRAGARLNLYRTDVSCPTVQMEGVAQAPAQLIISNLSNLYNGKGATAITGNGTLYNKVENYGGAKTHFTVANL